MCVVSTRGSASVLAPLLGACCRRGIDWGCFFTNDGVKVLADAAVLEHLSVATRAVVCDASWTRYMAGRDCPVELGSQTDHSAMLGEARRVVSL